MKKLKQIPIADINKSGIFIAILNILLGITLLIPTFFFFLYLLFSNFIPSSNSNNMEIMSFGIFLFFIAAFFMGGVNLFIGYKLLTDNKDRKKILTVSLILLHLPVWFIIYFLGYFLTMQILFPILPFIFSLIILLVTWNHKKKLAIILFIITITAIFLTTYNNFEENYCWRLANNAPNKDIMYPVATKQEKEMVGGNNSSVSGWLRIHLKCHNQFSWKLVFDDLIFHKNSVIQ